MSVYLFALVNAVLAAVVIGGIVGLLLWSLVTQHRDHGCQAVRLRHPFLPLRRTRLAARELEGAPQEVVLG